MLRKIATIIISILSVIATSAQPPAGAIRVTVQDSLSKQPLEDATISILKMPAAILLHRIRSRQQGATLHLTPGDYRIITTYLGYAADTANTTIAAGDTTTKKLRIL